MIEIPRKEPTVKQQLVGAALFGAVTGGAIYASRHPEQIAQLREEAMKQWDTLYSTVAPHVKNVVFNHIKPACGRLVSSVKDLFAQIIAPKIKPPVDSFTKG
jgi:hypothetical protein